MVIDCQAHVEGLSAEFSFVPEPQQRSLLAAGDFRAKRSLAELSLSIW
jgi:hypothetical protein